MSRSNPNEIIPNPSTRWFEWGGQSGNVRYYDKEKKENVVVDPFVVKSFKMKEPIADGFYASIRDKVAAAGGRFTSNLYIAFFGTGTRVMNIGSLQFHGAALSAWMEFSKENRADLYKSGISITGSKDGKKGSIKFKTPVFELQTLNEDQNREAVTLDQELQKFLDSYFKRPKVEQATPPTHEDAQELPLIDPPQKDEDGDEIPF